MKCWGRQIGDAAAPITIESSLRLYGNCETRVRTRACVDSGGDATGSESVRVYAEKNEWTKVESWAVEGQAVRARKVVLELITLVDRESHRVVHDPTRAGCKSCSRPIVSAWNGVGEEKRVLFADLDFDGLAR